MNEERRANVLAQLEKISGKVQRGRDYQDQADEATKQRRRGRAMELDGYVEQGQVLSLACLVGFNQETREMEEISVADAAAELGVPVRWAQQRVRFYWDKQRRALGKSGREPDDAHINALRDRWEAACGQESRAERRRARRREQLRDELVAGGVDADAADWIVAAYDLKKR